MESVQWAYSMCLHQLSLQQTQLLIFFICNVKMSEQVVERGDLNTLCPQLKTLNIDDGRGEMNIFSVLFVQAVLEHLSFCLDLKQ